MLSVTWCTCEECSTDMDRDKGRNKKRDRDRDKDKDRGGTVRRSEVIFL